MEICIYLVCLTRGHYLLGEKKMEACEPRRWHIASPSSGLRVRGRFNGGGEPKRTASVA
jgi:hypothetical protein